MSTLDGKTETDEVSSLHMSHRKVLTPDIGPFPLRGFRDPPVPVTGSDDGGVRDDVHRPN